MPQQEQSVVHKLDQLVLGTLSSSLVLLNLRVYLLQTQVLRVNEPCIGLTQENSIENSVQDGLPYILKPYDLC